LFVVGFGFSGLLLSPGFFFFFFFWSEFKIHLQLRIETSQPDDTLATIQTTITAMF